MKDVNKVILLGRLGADPIHRQTKTGIAVVNFSVATSRRVLQEESSPTHDATYSEETQWHKVVVWGKQGEACAQYLKKGSAIYLEGSIRSHNYEDKEGATKTSFEISADLISFIGNSRPSSSPETKEIPSDLPSL